MTISQPAGGACTPVLDSRTGIPAQRWWRVIPPILMVCIVSYMDRVNIAFAMPGGMSEALGIGAGMAGLAGGIFFAGYLFLQIPGGKLAVRGSGRRFIAWSMLAWAVLSVLTGLVRNQTELLILRFALGVAEGGMLPVVLTMIGNWFPDHERGRANALVILFVPIAGMITAPLSGLVIAALDWRWLFIIEGLISALCLALWWLLACDRPRKPGGSVRPNATMCWAGCMRSSSTLRRQGRRPRTRCWHGCCAMP